MFSEERADFSAVSAASCWALRKAPAMAGLEITAQELTPQRVNKLSGERVTAFLAGLRSWGFRSLLLAPAPWWPCVNWNHSKGNRWPPVPCLVVVVASAVPQEAGPCLHRQVEEPPRPPERHFAFGAAMNCRQGRCQTFARHSSFLPQTMSVSQDDWVQPLADFAWTWSKTLLYGTSPQIKSAAVLTPALEKTQKSLEKRFGSSLQKTFSLAVPCWVLYGECFEPSRRHPYQQLPSNVPLFTTVNWSQHPAGLKMWSYILPLDTRDIDLSGADLVGKKHKLDQKKQARNDRIAFLVKNNCITFNSNS